MAVTVTIDGVGRLVIPHDVRKRLHLHAGSRLRLSERGSEIVLEPEDSASALVEMAGLLVAAGSLAGPPPDHRDAREERLDSLARVED
mgnify:CR=1 FL=1